MEKSNYVTAFDERFKDYFNDYVVVKGTFTPYSLINIKDRQFIKFNDVEWAEYCCERLLEMNVPFYNSIKEVPGIMTW
jgi:hypothetical protein